jgi:protein TonB
VVHAVSATYLRFEHMSPPAAGMALLLHASVALALYLVSPLKFPDSEPAPAPIEVTMENSTQPAVQPPPPAPPEPKPAPTPAPQQAAPAQTPVPPPPPAAQRGPASDKPLGVTPSEPKTAEKPVQEPPKPAEPQQQQQQEAVAPPPKADLETVEKKLPEVAPPPAPLTMQDFVKIAPPPAPHEVAKTVPHPPPPPPQQRQTLQHSPLSTQQHQSPEVATAPNNTFVNPSQSYSRSRVMDEYQWAVIRKFSQYLPNLREKNEGGTVTLRFTIGRDGRLIEASIAKSSGIMALDRGLLDAVRVAAPYPALPPEFPGDRATFTLPIGAVDRR